MSNDDSVTAQEQSEDEVQEQPAQRPSVPSQRREEPEIQVPTLEELAARPEHAKVRVRYTEQIQQDVVNPMVLAALVGVRPQLVYNYIRDGKIKGAYRNSTGKVVIPLSEAQRWAHEYLSKKGVKLVEVQRQLAAAATKSE